jgi:hypothetical protein
MQGEKHERWEQLCALAAVEHDPEKLIVLVKEINRLLEEREQRFRGSAKTPELNGCRIPPHLG